MSGYNKGQVLGNFPETPYTKIPLLLFGIQNFREAVNSAKHGMGKEKGDK